MFRTNKNALSLTVKNYIKLKFEELKKSCIIDVYNASTLSKMCNVNNYADLK